MRVEQSFSESFLSVLRTIGLRNLSLEMRFIDSGGNHDQRALITDSTSVILCAFDTDSVREGL